VLGAGQDGALICVHPVHLCCCPPLCSSRCLQLIPIQSPAAIPIKPIKVTLLPARIPIYDRTRSSVSILCISVAALRFAAAIASCSSLSNHPLPSQSNRSKSLCSRKKSSYRSKVHLGLGRCAAWRVIGACAAGGGAGPRAVYSMAGPHIGEQNRAPNLHTGGHLANWERQLT
jgi:hypothetical protein